MKSIGFPFLYLCTLTGASSVASGNHGSYDVRPFTISLSHDVPRMLERIRDTELPDAISQYPGNEAGISLETLKAFRNQWLVDFDWFKEEESLNRYHHFTAKIENLDVHFIHEKSNEPDAIPLILYHGWPGSFLEFIPLIKNLTQKAKTSTGKHVSFDVIVPSLPGFAFSSAPGANWTVDDSARVFNTLMTKVLGYKTYAVHATGSGYFIEEGSKPNDIGLVLYDNPVGQLVWIGEKYIEWSDPKAGTSPSVLTHNEILRIISLYYLTKSILSSGYIYFQNPLGQTGFRYNYTRARTDAPMLFSAFKYNVHYWPRALAETVGNLVLYRNHDFGGHFPGLDNPPALIEDIREIGSYWE
ncbi:alpha/beta hydrolase fold domain-containing protein [Trichoderma breve]|uniref:Alpha/beta hydrolase fold domain-containing protein n=1 Tax=Trichoderma breve TaxID=2034170 RepID=A0A9W9JQE4_9HYPO|nr:alpha/beta hydrolase fold domain-containing protein [Trichoderma breve]KAJ4864059.1 alpha/beta hydrolase fold domain-containing protein [Trichoderma breve]